MWLKLDIVCLVAAPNKMKKAGNFTLAHPVDANIIKTIYNFIKILYNI